VHIGNGIEPVECVVDTDRDTPILMTPAEPELAVR